MSIGLALFAVGLACLAVAFVAGEREERAFVAAQAVSSFFEHAFARSGDVATAVLVDLGVLAVVLPIALRTRKVWPLIVASLCVATLMSEAAQLTVHASAAAYGLLQGVWDLLADLVVAAAAVGLWRSRRAGRAPTTS